MNKSKYYALFVAPVILLLMVTATNAQAWNGGYWGAGNYGYGNGDGVYQSGYYGHGYGYQVGYQAGQTQAQSDYQSDLTYNPTPVCCHSYRYDQGYQAAYSAEWNSLSIQQKQTSTQGLDSRINVEGNNNVVGVNQEQSSAQQQSGGSSGSYPDNTNNAYPGSNPQCKVLCLSVR